MGFSQRVLIIRETTDHDKILGLEKAVFKHLVILAWIFCFVTLYFLKLTFLSVESQYFSVISCFRDSQPFMCKFHKKKTHN